MEKQTDLYFARENILGNYNMRKRITHCAICSVKQEMGVYSGTLVLK